MKNQGSGKGIILLLGLMVISVIITGCKTDSVEQTPETETDVQEEKVKNNQQNNADMTQLYIASNTSSYLNPLPKGMIVRLKDVLLNGEPDWYGTAFVAETERISVDEFAERGFKSDICKHMDETKEFLRVRIIQAVYTAANTSSREIKLSTERFKLCQNGLILENQGDKIYDTVEGRYLKNEETLNLGECFEADNYYIVDKNNDDMIIVFMSSENAWFSIYSDNELSESKNKRVRYYHPSYICADQYQAAVGDTVLCEEDTYKYEIALLEAYDGKKAFEVMKKINNDVSENYDGRLVVFKLRLTLLEPEEGSEIKPVSIPSIFLFGNLYETSYENDYSDKVKTKLLLADGTSKIMVEGTTQDIYAYARIEKNKNPELFLSDPDNSKFRINVNFTEENP